MKINYKSENHTTGKIKIFTSYTFVCFFLVLFPFYCFSQNINGKEKEVISMSAGIGSLTFYGDVGGNSIADGYSFIRNGYFLSFEKKIRKNVSLSLNLLRGKIAREGLFSDKFPRLNFQSPLTQFSLNGIFSILVKEEQSVIPFVSAGFSFILFDPHGDLLDKNGNTYYYWKDGSIRDLPESPENMFYAKNIGRDYTYESKLTNTDSYPRQSFALPLTAGFKFKLSSHIDANLSFAYHMAFSDDLDNVKFEGNDNYIFSSVSITAHIFTLPKKEKEKVAKFYAELDKTDTDKDGIPDTDDVCLNTPKNAKTDSKGCPVDSDKDGVPDYADKEPLSKGESAVDINGRAITKTQLEEIKKKNTTVIASKRKYVNSLHLNEKPSAEFMKQLEEMQQQQKTKNLNRASERAIPANLLIADINKDNYISSEEISKTIDAFFEGSINFTTEQIHELVTFFFEQ